MAYMQGVEHHRPNMYTLSGQGERLIRRRRGNTIWEDTYECTEQYICATDVYLLSILSHDFKQLLIQKLVHLVMEKSC